MRLRSSTGPVVSPGPLPWHCALKRVTNIKVTNIKVTNIKRSVDFVDSGAPAVSVSSKLDVALESLTEARLSWVPVLDDDRRVVGTLSVSDVVHVLRPRTGGECREGNRT